MQNSHKIDHRHHIIAIFIFAIFSVGLIVVTLAGTDSNSFESELAESGDGASLIASDQDASGGEYIEFKDAAVVPDPDPDPGPNPDPNPDPDPDPTPSPAYTFVSDSPVPIPKCGAYWSTYLNPDKWGGGQDPSAQAKAYTDFETYLGRTIDSDHRFYRWDNFIKQYNIDNVVKPSIAKGRIPMLSWKSWFSDGSNMSWAEIVDGEHDELIREKAKAVKSLGVPVFMIYGHEANSRVGEFDPDFITDGNHNKALAGSEAEFVASWIKIHDIFEAEGADNAAWTWIMTRTPFFGDATLADRLYPGEQYVDWVGLDPYNFFSKPGQWYDMDTLMQGFTDWVESRDIKKPWILAEWGSVEDPNVAGRKAEWLKKTADYFESEPRIKTVSYFNSNPFPNWLTDTSESSKQAFKEISNRPYFKQTGCSPDQITE